MLHGPTIDCNIPKANEILYAFVQVPPMQCLLIHTQINKRKSHSLDDPVWMTHSLDES